MFLFLLLEEHPYGREMLSQLLGAGFRPELILQEVGPLAESEREKFLERIAGHPVAATVEEQAAESGVRVVSVPRHDDGHCLEVIREVEPDLLVLGGTRIIRGGMLEYPRGGVLNSHPVLLPDCRGSASPAWSVYHDIPIGSSCHFCTAGIDEGDLVGRREIEVRRGDTYADLCYKTLLEAGVLMCEALTAYSEGRLADLRGAQGPSPHPTFRNMPDELLGVVHDKLRQQTYAHYSN